MEEAITAGRVTVNGKPAELGMRVGPDDRIGFDGHPLRARSPSRLPRVLLYHKPEGEIVSHDDPEGRASVFENLPRVFGAKWLSIGRLDYNTEGLLIFTTSGELANRLSHPRFEVEREYAVRVLGELTPDQAAQLTAGIPLEDGDGKFESIEEEGGGEGINRWYRVVVKEGRNRIVRRLFEALGFTVSRLTRIRFGLVGLPPRLKRGQLVELEEEEVSRLLDWAESLAEGAEPSRSAR